jgi:dipeptidyl aminopeptidase/acylaminoacyl peptidase
VRIWSVAIALLAALEARAQDVPGFKLDGERFTYVAGDRTVRGVFVKPDGAGPFPALLISHGRGGSAEAFARPRAREFVKWGFVCIGPDYAHAGQGGDQKDFGASAENIARATACLDLLAKLRYVDMKRVGAFGHSMGAFLTIGLAAAVPDRLQACAISAGGVAPRDGFAAPSVATASKVRTPFLILHGSADTTVPPERSLTFKEALDRSKVPNERFVYEGVGHGLPNEKADDVNARLKKWFEERGVLKR